MTRRFRNTILIMGAGNVVLCASVWFLVRAARGIRVGTAVVSHTLCSGAFVSGLDPDFLYAEAVKPIPGQRVLSKRLKYVVDRAGRQVIVTWAGGFQSRAVYRDGFGCIILHGDESKVAATGKFPGGEIGTVSAPHEEGSLEVQPPEPKLEAALDRAFTEPSQPPYRRVKAIVILHNGNLVAERYAPGYRADTPILGYSLAKSVTNALIGILVRQKKLAVEQRAPVPQWDNPSDPRHGITIDQLLRMTSGLALEESDTGFDPVSRMLFLESDMAGYAEHARLQAALGSKWDYTSGNTLILSRIIRDAVGGRAQDVVEFARRELFEPLGITTATIEFDATGTPVGSIYIFASARDWARLGALYLNDGVVHGRRILPEGWVNYSAAPTLDTDYGAGFWTNRGSHGDANARIHAGMPEDSFYGSGNLGQRIVIIPSAGLVIVRLGLTHYNGLQITAMKRLGHGFMGQLNYTWSRCMDTVSNGGFLQFSAGGILSPLPGDLARDYGPCDYDIRHNLNAQYVYQLPLKFKSRSLAYALKGWQLSGTVFWHSGIPFSVLSTPYSANGNGIVNGSGPQFASMIPGVPLYEHKPIPGVTQPGTVQWLNPNAFVSTVDPSTGACYGGNSPKICQFGNLGRNALRGPDFAWSDFYLTKWFPLTERVKLRFDTQFFNVFNHPNFGLPSMVLAGIPGKPSTQTGFGALTYTTSPPTGLLGVGLGGDSTPRMIAFQARLEF